MIYFSNPGSQLDLLVKSTRLHFRAIHYSSPCGVSSLLLLRPIPPPELIGGAIKPNILGIVI